VRDGSLFPSLFLHYDWPVFFSPRHFALRRGSLCADDPPLSVPCSRVSPTIYLVTPVLRRHNIFLWNPPITKVPSFHLSSLSPTFFILSARVHRIFFCSTWADLSLSLTYFCSLSGFSPFSLPSLPHPYLLCTTIWTPSPSAPPESLKSLSVRHDLW